MWIQQSIRRSEPRDFSTRGCVVVPALPCQPELHYLKNWRKTKYQFLQPQGPMLQNFYSCNLQMRLIRLIGKSFQPSLMCSNKAGAFLGGAPVLWGRLIALPTNIRLGRKGRPGTNTLAYCVHLKITALFIDLYIFFLHLWLSSMSVCQRW